MSISPLSPRHDMAAIPLAQSKGAAAEGAAHAADARARLVDGQQRSEAAGEIDGTLGDNNVPDDRESAERPPWQASSSPSPHSPAAHTPDDRSGSALGGSLDLTA